MAVDREITPALNGAARRQSTPRPKSPALLLANNPASQARRFGAAKPPRLPMELISPMPPAAAAPPSKPVGKVQNKAGDTIKPHAATLSATSATSGEPVSADTARPAPEMPKESAPMPRELPLASHQGGMIVAATSA